MKIFFTLIAIMFSCTLAQACQINTKTTLSGPISYIATTRGRTAFFVYCDGQSLYPCSVSREQITSDQAFYFQIGDFTYKISNYSLNPLIYNKDGYLVFDQNNNITIAYPNDLEQYYFEKVSLGEFDCTIIFAKGFRPSYQDLQNIQNMAIRYLPAQSVQY